MLQSLPHDVKIEKTKIRIKEWYEYYNGEVYVSFSGGKDSTVLLHLVRSIYPDVVAVFVDTGLEYPEVRDFVKTIDNVIWLKPKMNFKQVILKYGYPVVSKEQSGFIHEYRTTKSEKLKNIRWNGNRWNRGKISNKWKYLVNAPFKISNKCCDIMKKNPSKKFEKQSGLHPYLGVMTDESAARKTSWMKTGCNGFNAKRPISKPLSFWSEQDIFKYIVDNDLKISDAYGDIVLDENGIYRTTKCDRTGCVFCMYGCHLEKNPNRFQRLHETHPKIYEFCMKPISSGGLGMKEILEYIGIDV